MTGEEQGNYRKVMTLSVEFDLTNRRHAKSRIINAYKEAVQAAVEAVKSQLLQGSIAEYRAS